MIKKVIKKIKTIIMGFLEDNYIKEIVDDEKKLNKAIKKAKKNGAKFRGWALTEGAIKLLFKHIKNCKNIVEFGSGSSTLVFHELTKDGNSSFKITSFEHHPMWYQFVSDKVINNKQIKLIKKQRKKITDKEYEALFQSPQKALSIFGEFGQILHDDTSEQMYIKNAFYDLKKSDLEDNYDVVILDGPHGNGRSIAYPLLYNTINPGTIVFIDDFDHYPFVNEFYKLFQADILHCSNLLPCSWIILKVLAIR